MSRYIERAENNARILEVNQQLMLDFEQSEATVRQHWAPIINSLEEHELFHKFYAEATVSPSSSSSPSSRRTRTPSTRAFPAPAKTPAACANRSPPRCGSTSTSFTCSFIRSEARELFQSSSYQFFKHILQGSFQFIGITDATMTHGEGWQFIQLGKFLERADRTSRILDVKYHILLPSGERVGGNVDTVQWMAVLRSCSALEAYTKLYVGQIAPWKVAEFLIFNDSFPRALRHCIHQVDYALHNISGVPEDRFSNETERLTGKLRGELDYTRIGEVFQNGLHQYLDRFQKRAVGDQRRDAGNLLRDPVARETPRSSGNPRARPRKAGARSRRARANPRPQPCADEV